MPRAATEEMEEMAARLLMQEVLSLFIMATEVMAAMVKMEPIYLSFPRVRQLIPVRSQILAELAELAADPAAAALADTLDITAKTEGMVSQFFPKFFPVCERRSVAF